MSKTIRMTRMVQNVGEKYIKLPEGLHKREHWRCRCSWCLSLTKKRILNRFAKEEINAED